MGHIDQWVVMRPTGLLFGLGEQLQVIPHRREHEDNNPDEHEDFTEQDERPEDIPAQKPKYCTYDDEPEARISG